MLCDDRALNSSDTTLGSEGSEEFWLIKFWVSVICSLLEGSRADMGLYALVADVLKARVAAFAAAGGRLLNDVGSLPKDDCLSLPSGLKVLSMPLFFSGEGVREDCLCSDDGRGERKVFLLG